MATLSIVQSSETLSHCREGASSGMYLQPCIARKAAMYMFALISRCMVKFHMATDSASMLKQVALLTLRAKGIGFEFLQIELLPGRAPLHDLTRP